MGNAVKATALLVVVIFASHSSPSAAEDAAKNGMLVEQLLAGHEILVYHDGRKVIIAAEGKRTELSQAQLENALKEVLAPQALTAVLKQDAKLQNLLLPVLGFIDREVLDRSHVLKAELFHFYIRMLNAADAEVGRTALEQIFKRRSYENALSKYFDNELRKIFMEFVKKNPEAGDSDENNPGGFKNAISLLGMSGAGAEAISMLEGFAGKVPQYELSRRVALARLGVAAQQEALINDYETEADLLKKWLLALALGQTSVDACLRVLARDLRSDLVIPGDGKEGFNQSVLGGLCRAESFPQGQVSIWGVGGYDQKHFDMAEAWAAKTFGTKWDVPKPKVRKLKAEKF